MIDSSQDQVEIWLLPLTPELAQSLASDSWLECIKGEDRRRLEGIGNGRRREEFLASRLLLHHLAKRYFPTIWKEVETKRDAGGRPFWYLQAKRLSRYFSLSHTRGLICCAISHQPLIGCDIEQLRPRKNLAELSARVFSPAEEKIWQGLEKKERLNFFYRSWTLKEAFAKALGKGLQLPFDSIPTHQIPLGSPTTLRGRDLGLASGTPAFTLVSLRLAPDFFFAAACGLPKSCFRFNLAELAGLDWIGHRSISPPLLQNP